MASRDERHTVGHTTDGDFGGLTGAQVPRYLGRFRRELLMHLAAREARIMLHGAAADRRKLKASGLAWQPAKAVHSHLDYTKQSLADRVSKALRALEDFGYIRTSGHAEGRRRTTHVKLTTAGLREAVDIAARWGHSPRSWRAKAHTQPEVDLLKGELLDASTDQGRAAIKRELRRARRFAVSEMARRDDEERWIRKLERHQQRNPDDAEAAAALEWQREFRRLFDASGPWERLERYADTARWLREDVATSSHEVVRGWADEAEAMLFQYFKE